MKITLAMLRSKKACPEQYQLFKKLFEDGTEVTEKLAIKALVAGLDLNWAASNLFKAPALKAYREAMAPALKAFQDVMAPALKAYRDVMATAEKVYQDVKAPAEKAYREAMAPAEKAYREAMAKAFAMCAAMCDEVPVVKGQGVGE